MWGELVGVILVTTTVDPLACSDRFSVTMIGVLQVSIAFFVRISQVSHAVVLRIECEIV